MFALYGIWWHPWKCTEFWPVTQFVLSASFQIMEHLAQCGLDLKVAISNISHYVIIFHKKQSHYVENIIAIPSLLLKLQEKIYVWPEVRYTCDPGFRYKTVCCDAYYQPWKLVPFSLETLFCKKATDCYQTLFKNLHFVY